MTLSAFGKHPRSNAIIHVFGYSQQIYVINESDRRDRRFEMVEQLSGIGLNYESSGARWLRAVQTETTGKFSRRGTRGSFLTNCGVIDRTLGNLFKAPRANAAKSVSGKPRVAVEQSSRIPAELACNDGERHFSKSDGALCPGAEANHAFNERKRPVWHSFSDQVNNRETPDIVGLEKPARSAAWA